MESVEPVATSAAPRPAPVAVATDSVFAQRKAAFAAMRARNAPRANKALPGSKAALFQNARRAMAAIATYGQYEGAPNAAVAAGTGVLVSAPDRSSTGFVLVSNAHIAIPQFEPFRRYTFPYLVNPAPQDETNQEFYGAVQYQEWPFFYRADVFVPGDAFNERFFVELNLIGADWAHDLAFFDVVIEDPDVLAGFLATALPLGAGPNPAEGEEVYALSDMFEQTPIIFIDGVVRQASYQPNGEFAPHAVTSLALDAGSSGCPVLQRKSEDEPDQPVVVGIQYGGINGGPDWSLNVPLEDLRRVMGQYVDGANFLESIGAQAKIVAVSRSVLGFAGRQLTVASLGFATALPNQPENGYIQPGGYVFDAAEPYSGVQSNVLRQDVILAVYDPDTGDRYPLGPYAPEQYTLEEAIRLAGSSGSVDLDVVRWSVGSYAYAPETLYGVKVTNDLALRSSFDPSLVDSWWLWFFRWAMPPQGMPPSQQRAMASPFLQWFGAMAGGEEPADPELRALVEKQIADTVLWRQSNNTENPDPTYFFPLGTRSVRAENFSGEKAPPAVSEQQSQRVSQGILREVEDFLALIARASMGPGASRVRQTQVKQTRWVVPEYADSWSSRGPGASRVRQTQVKQTRWVVPQHADAWSSREFCPPAGAEK